MRPVMVRMVSWLRRMILARGLSWWNRRQTPQIHVIPVAVFPQRIIRLLVKVRAHLLRARHKSPEVIVKHSSKDSAPAIFAVAAGCYLWLLQAEDNREKLAHSPLQTGQPSAGISDPLPPLLRRSESMLERQNGLLPAPVTPTNRQHPASSVLPAHVGCPSSSRYASTVIVRVSMLISSPIVLRCFICCC
jgi:hypothetical protein